jgi:hypothetical protein
MLDNIVNDGMRVAAEVRRRYDEAQKELDAQSQHGRDEDEDQEEKDADLLEGAETADVVSIKEENLTDLLSPDLDKDLKSTKDRRASDASRRVVEFESDKA